MKKFILSALLVLTALTGAMAAWPDRPISLNKTSKPPATKIHQTVQGEMSIDVSGISTGYYQLVAYIDGQMVSSQKILI